MAIITGKMRKVKFVKLKNDPQGYRYQCAESYIYYSTRYNRSVTVPLSFMSDGATGAPDLNTDAWWVHDVLCDKGTWDDGTPIDNWDASTVLGDILWHDGYRFLAVVWWWATWLYGGGVARENGLRRVHG